MQLHEIVNIDPETMGGTPVFKGTRVSVQSLFDWLAEGIPLSDFLENFPGVTSKQVLSIIELKFKFPELYETIIGPQHPEKLQVVLD